METMPNIQRMPDSSEGGALESKEKHEFSLEEIKKVLMQIDGKERPNLDIKERKENIKGELMFIEFSDGEKEIIGDEEHDVTYLLTVAGQRYKADGSEGALLTKTFLTKNYDDGMFDSKELGDYIDGAWSHSV